MVNKRELVLLLSLAFCFGVIFSDFTKPKSIVAETTNIVYDTLDAKIVALTKRFNTLSSKVNSIEAKSSVYDTKISSLAQSVKDLAAVQKETLGDFASEEDLKTLSEKVAKIEQAIRKLNTIQKIQNNSN